MSEHDSQNGYNLLLPQVLDDIVDSVYIMKVEQGTFKYAYVNKAATEASGITMDSVGQDFYQTTTEQMADYLHKKYYRVLLEGRSVKYEDGYIKPDGMLSGESIMTPIRDDEGEIEYIVCVTRDTTERTKSEDLLRYYAYHDDLTRLHNRRYLFEQVDRPFLIALFDLDYFKKINDTFGHDAGDEVLMEAARRLLHRFGNEYAIIRLSGDEFVVASTKPVERPDVLAEALLELFDSPFVLSSVSVNIGVSVGLAVRTQEQGVDALLKQADIALYKCKEEGRRRFHIFKDDAQYDHITHFKYELALHEAVRQESFRLQFQPIFSPTTQRVVAIEALIRWHHEEVGPIPPNDFIPIAEGTGLILPIGDWVIRHACRAWHRLSPVYGPKMKVSVNVSGIQLSDPAFIDRLVFILQNENVVPSAMVVEITESTVIDNVERVRNRLQQLRELGFWIALDDFGTGYSSLSMLTTLPLDAIKLDRSFIQNMNTSVLSAILFMAKALRLKVIAEGVETGEQQAKLAEMGFDGVQGYYFSKPKDMEDLLSNGDQSLAMYNGGGE